MARRMSRSQRGFSIIELSVVNATIAVLATIAIPKFQHAYNRAKQVEAVQTVASLQRALTEYYNRQGEYPPTGGAANPTQPISAGKLQMTDGLAGWRDLGFKPDASYRYRYSFACEVGLPKCTKVTITAVSDLNQDGIPGQLVRTLKEGYRITNDVEENFGFDE